MGQAASAGAQDVLKGGMDKNGLYHALRRRWLLSSCMGLLLAGTVSGLLYIFFPPSFSAKVQYKADANPLNLLDRGGSPTQTKDFKIYKQTQVAYIRSPYVLTAALRDPQISQLPMLNP